MDFLFCYHVTLMLMASFAFVLLVIGFATPGWLLVTFEETTTDTGYTVSSLNRSLWYDVMCPRELRDCKTCVHSDSQECANEMGYPGYSSHYSWVMTEIARDDKAQWEVWQGLETAVVVCAFFGFILVVCIVCCLLQPSNYRIVCTVGCVLWFIAGILVWPVVGMVADMHLTIEDEINNNIFHDASLDTPYSLVLSAVGGFFALITAIMLLWLIGLCRGREDDVSTNLMDDRRSKHASVLRSQSYYGPYPYYPPERQTEYREAPRRDMTRDYSVTTDEEFYVIDSPYYVPAYYNRHYGSDFYDRKRQREESGNGNGSSGRR